MKTLKLTKCLDEYYLDFLIYLNGFELGGLRIYDLFKAIYRSEIDIAKCYKTMAGLYFALENSLGDPQVVLYKLSEIVPRSKLSTFLKGYGNVLLTSGDTKTFVTTSLKTEYTSTKAKVSELLKSVEVIYESILVIILSVLTLTVLPIWPLHPLLGVFILQSIGLIAYVVSLNVVKRIYYTTPLSIISLDMVFLLSSSVLLISPISGIIVHLLIFIALHVTSKRKTDPVIKIEAESITILNEVYSKVLLGDTVDTALLSSLSTSRLQVFKTLWYGLLNGLRCSEVLPKLRLPLLAEKIVSLLGSLVQYSPSGNTYVAVITQFVDEISSLKRYVVEKARFYILYSIILALLIAASYMMIKQLPGQFHGNAVSTLGTYGYIGVIASSLPALLIKDGGFVSSRTSILIIILALIVLLLIVGTPT